MLPSKGFFKKNDCPFFEKGLCVRPHCHFRHRKKVVNDNEPTTETEEGEDNEAEEEELLKLIAENRKLLESSKAAGGSSSESSEAKEEQSAHDTLFAKLVNQTNTYEKISRHIPCAYTPTPQTRTVEAKNKSVSAISGFDSEKSLELITKARTLLQKNCVENIKKLEVRQTADESGDNGNEQNRSESGEEQSSAGKKDEVSVKGCGNEDSCDEQQVLEKDYDRIPEYIPSKETTTSSKYVPNYLEGNSEKYVPSKETSKESPYVPENITTVDKTLLSIKADDEKDLEGFKNCSETTLSEIEFISSEIEMMKKLLDEEETDKKEESKQENAVSETENVEKKSSKSSFEEHRESNKSHSSHRRHSSHSSKSRSSRSSHPSSKSRHSRHSSSHSRSSSSSSRHRSSSSRHHSSSISSHHRSSSDRHKSSRHSKKDRNKRHGEESDSGPEKKKCKPEKKFESGDEVDFENATSDYDEENELVVFKKMDESTFPELGNDEDLEDDPDTVEKECLAIFNSYSNCSEKTSKSLPEITVPNPENESTVYTKKRTAHSTSAMADHSSLRHKTVKKPNSVKSPQELLYERYKTCEKSKEFAPTPAQSSNHAPLPGMNRPSIRIAAVSNIQQMLLAKQAIQEKINKGLKVNERTTIAHTVVPGGARVAHVPKISQELKEKPIIIDGSKQVPRVKRQSYLDKLLIETNEIFPTKSESAEEALKLEQEIFKSNSGSSAAYHAAFVSLLMKTRRRVASLKGETTCVNNGKAKVSHFDVLSGGKKNFSIVKTKRVDISMLSDKQIYHELLRCKLTPEELKENGFPISCDRPGYASCSLNYELKYNDKYQHIKKITGNRRYCIRCSKQYDIDPVTLKQLKEGPETCSYHPGRKKSGGRNCERIYNCCNTSSTEGCATHVRHVTDCNDYENYPNCVRTLSKEGETNPGVFALDCEMVYTRLGSELARVTVVNLKKEIVYDTLVKPKHPIECYNTFYSGIEEKMMEGIETTLKDVQAVLLSMFSDKTILVGHSLDSDLRALHLIHDTVVDTSVVYKNEKYHPYKYSLKDLCAKKISKIIQDNINGHDSSEDAIAALEIMLQYVKEEVAKYDSMESYEADRGGYS